MEYLSDPNNVIEPEQATERDVVVQLQEELSQARQSAANAISRLDSFRSAVRETVIENIKDGTICLRGADEALESWGEQPYVPRYVMRLTVDVEVTVDADDADDARNEALNVLEIETGDYSNYIHDTYVADVEPASED